jgi:hypothetical protein
MKIKRREFLTKSALGLGGALLGTQLLTRGEATAKPFDPFERVPLGKTKLKFSRVVLGTGMKGGHRESNQTRMGKEKFMGLILTSSRPSKVSAVTAIKSSAKSGGTRAAFQNRNVLMRTWSSNVS